MLRVHSVETCGTREGPGLRLVVFLQGCNMRCLYCHNPDTWQMNTGKEYKINKLVEIAKRNREYYQPHGGITISGGEPLLQRVELLELFKEFKKIGFHTALDTNGSILDNATHELLEFTDLVLLDIKHIDHTQHKRLTGINNDMPLNFAKYLQEKNKPFWLRYVLVPGYTDTPDDIYKLGKHFADYENLQKFEIIPYHTLGMYKYRELGISYSLNSVKAPSSSDVARAQEIFWGKRMPQKR